MVRLIVVWDAPRNHKRDNENGVSDPGIIWEAGCSPAERAFDDGSPDVRVRPSRAGGPTRYS